jgi:hypothetical protein
MIHLELLFEAQALEKHIQDPKNAVGTFRNTVLDGVPD